MGIGPRRDRDRDRGSSGPDPRGRSVPALELVRKTQVEAAIGLVVVASLTWFAMIRRHVRVRVRVRVPREGGKAPQHVLLQLCEQPREGGALGEHVLAKGAQGEGARGQGGEGVGWVGPGTGWVLGQGRGAEESRVGAAGGEWSPRVLGSGR